VKQQDNPLTLSGKKKKKDNKMIIDDEDVDSQTNNIDKNSLVDIIPDNHPLLVRLLLNI
jgi:hypothetical protein